MPFLNPRTYSELATELRKRPFRVQLAFCWLVGLFWIAAGLFIPGTRIWAVALGILFLVVPFISRARQHRSEST